VDQPAPGTAVFRMEGRLRGWPECFEFQEEVRKRVTGDDKHIVLDLREVEHVDSTGVGILASIYTSVKNARGELVLAELAPKVQKILDVLWFLRVLDHEPTVEKALAKLQEKS
jgi:anti-anti-sigma factor